MQHCKLLCGHSSFTSRSPSNEIRWPVVYISVSINFSRENDTFDAGQLLFHSIFLEKNSFRSCRASSAFFPRIINSFLCRRRGSSTAGLLRVGKCGQQAAASCAAAQSRYQRRRRPQSQSLYNFLSLFSPPAIAVSAPQIRILMPFLFFSLSSLIVGAAAHSDDVG